jgi:hypothetical protein
MRVAFEVVAKGFERSDNGEEFLIMDFVVLLSWLEGFGMKGNRVPPVEEVRLFEDRSNSEVTSVCDESERGGTIWKHEDWCRGESSDKSIEGGLSSRGPIVGSVLLGELEERVGNL